MPAEHASRRKFLKAAAAAGTLAVLPEVHAAGSDILRVGLVGCGDRGTGAASQALAADSGARLVAMADAFEDRLESSLETLRKNEAIAAKLDVAPARRFVGFDAYRQLLEQRGRRGPALHAAALPADPPPRRGRGRQARLRREAGGRRRPRRPLGARELRAGRSSKGLSVVSGLCLRYDNGFRETVRRIHDGAIGEVADALRQRLSQRPMGQAEAARTGPR